MGTGVGLAIGDGEDVGTVTVAGELDAAGEFVRAALAAGGRVTGAGFTLPK